MNKLLRTDNRRPSSEIYDDDDDDDVDDINNDKDDEVRIRKHVVVLFVHATCPLISVSLITLILLQLD